jgi:hypothetical protein
MGKHLFLVLTATSLLKKTSHTLLKSGGSMRRTLLALSASVFAIGALILAGCSKESPPTGPSGWTNVGTPVSSGEASEGKMFVSNGTPYVVYKDYTNGYKETMMKFDGTAWVPVGTPGFTAGSVSNVK